MREDVDELIKVKEEQQGVLDDLALLAISASRCGDPFDPSPCQSPRFCCLSLGRLGPGVGGCELGNMTDLSQVAGSVPSVIPRRRRARDQVRGVVTTLVSRTTLGQEDIS